MSLGALGAWVLVLLAVFLTGRLWFRFVESILDRIRALLTRHREPPAWHPLPQEEDKEAPS